MRGGFQAETAVLRQGSMSTERGKIMQENLSYEKLSKRALNCMYTAGAATGAAVLAVIGAVDYFWIFHIFQPTFIRCIGNKLNEVFNVLTVLAVDQIVTDRLCYFLILIIRCCRQVGTNCVKDFL